MMPDDNTFLLPIINIEVELLNYLDPIIDFQQLAMINRYYYNIVINNPVFNKFKDFITETKENEIFMFDLDEDLYNSKNISKNFIIACKYNYLSIAQYISFHKNYSSYDSEIGFKWSCLNGHIDVCKWLYSMSIQMKDPINIHTCNEYPFRWSCTKGHIDVSKWLFDLSIKMDSPINIHADNEYPFRWSCSENHLEVAKWLYELSISINSPIDIHVCNEYAFRHSCIKGNYEVSKWLYQLGNDIGSPINIRMYDDEVFVNSCKNGDFIIANWLCSICDNYYINSNTIDGTIRYYIIPN